jgi:superkiller protein 3
MGTLDAVGLARAVGGTGDIKDVQKGVVLAPWAAEGWGALVECVRSA